MLKRILNKIESIYKYRYFSRNEKGAYKFLLKKIHKSTDIDFIEHIWQLDYFREILEPIPLELHKMKRVLVLAPHQDDELLGCGGTLVQLAKNNCQITIAFLTDGAELSNPNESVPIRQKEAAAVCKALNADMRELGISNISMKIESGHLERLTHWLDEGWDAVFAIWPVDQPPKHRVCSYLLGKALAVSQFTGDVLLYAVHTDLLPNCFVDISEVINKKQHLLASYESQMKMQRLDHMSKGLDAWRSRFLASSNKAGYIETFMQIPTSAYHDFQNIYETTHSHKLFKGNEACIHAFNALKRL